MWKQIRLLCGIQLCNVLGVNEARHSRDPRRRRRLWLMLFTYLFLGLVLLCYAGGLSYALLFLGAGAQAVPLVLSAAAAIVIFAVTAYRAGPVLFSLKSYERDAALPVRPAAIVISRFATMYVSNAALCLLILLPGAVACGICATPAWHFYPLMLLGALFLPLLPMTAAMVLGALIYAIASRMRHKNLIVVLLSMLLVFALLLSPLLLPAEDSLQGEQLFELVQSALGQVSRSYPPAAWFAGGVASGQFGAYALFAAGSILLFVLLALLIGRHFQSICSALGSHALSRNYVAREQRSRTPLLALYKKELRRYFSSSIYVMNTLIGHLLAVLVSAMILFMGTGFLSEQFPIAPEQVVAFLPFLLAALYALSPTTASAISIEGKQWWLTKSLPVETKTILCGKLLVNLTVALPCWVISEALLCVALRPTGFALLWLIVLPLCYLLFSSVLGLALNLRMPALNWDSETVAVKQGRAVLFNMLICLPCAFLPAVLLPSLSPAAGNAACAGIALLTLLGAAALYRNAARARLSAVNETA